MNDLRGQVAMVAGASGGIGSAVALLLAECGADIALSCHANAARAGEVADSIVAMGRRVRLDTLDATDAGAARDWVAGTIAAFGKVDVLANCCGWSGAFQLFKDQDPAAWSRIIAIELTACFNLSHAVLHHMVARRRGRIITLGSDSSKTGLSGAAVTAAARGGVNAFSKSLARELGRYGVTVNVVCPGPTQTPVLDMLRAQGETGEKLVQGLIAAIPMKRVGTPREVAAAVAFLASEEGGFITGQAISVSGGLSMV